MCVCVCVPPPSPFYNACAPQIDCTTVLCVCVRACLRVCLLGCPLACFPRCMLLYQRNHSHLFFFFKLRRFANSIWFLFIYFFTPFSPWFTFFLTVNCWGATLFIMCFALVLVTDLFLKAFSICSFFSEHREYFPNPCLSLPPITGANVILSILNY